MNEIQYIPSEVIMSSRLKIGDFAFSLIDLYRGLYLGSLVKEVRKSGVSVR